MLHTQTTPKRPKPDADHVRGATAGQKTVENQDWAAGRRVVAVRGARAAGPLGRGPAFSKTQFYDVSISLRSFQV